MFMASLELGWKFCFWAIKFTSKTIGIWRGNKKTPVLFVEDLEKIMFMLERCKWLQDHGEEIKALCYAKRVSGKGETDTILLHAIFLAALIYFSIHNFHTVNLHCSANDNGLNEF